MMIQAEEFLLKWHCAAHSLAFLLVSCIRLYFFSWLFYNQMRHRTNLYSQAPLPGSHQFIWESLHLTML